MSNIFKEIIKEEKLKDKIILDISKEDGSTALLLAEHTDSLGGRGKIISVNEAPRNKKEFSKKLGGLKKFVEVKTTSPEKLDFIKNKSIDFIFSFETIHILNANICRLRNSLKEFRRILKPTGKLMVINEYPLTKIKKDADIVQATRTNLNKSVVVLTGEILQPEILPEDLIKVLKELGYSKISRKKIKRRELNMEIMNEWYEAILKKLSHISNDRLRDAFLGEIENVKRLFYHKGGLSAPYYIVEAKT